MAEIKVRVGSKNAIKVPATLVDKVVLWQLSGVDVSGSLSNGMVLVIMDQQKIWINFRINTRHYTEFGH